MFRIVAAVATGLAGLVASGVWFQEEPGNGKADEVRIGVDADVEVQETDRSLEEAYDLLARLRAEKPDGQPGELLKRAVDMYRKAVALYDKAGVGEVDSEAGRLAAAALELARTVDRLNEVRRDDNPDAELPAPPRGWRSRVMVLRPDGKTATVPPALVVTREPGQRQVKVFVKKDGDSTSTRSSSSAGSAGEKSVAQAKVYILQRPDQKQDGKGLIEFELKVDEDEIEELTDRLQEEARKLSERYSQQIEEHFGDLSEPAFRWLGVRPPAEEAQVALQRAHDRINAARESDLSEDDAFYIDAARDLYNAARRDAVAGRHERAAELAKAAEALTLVPEHLSGTRRSHDPDEDVLTPPAVIAPPEEPAREAMQEEIEIEIRPPADSINQGDTEAQDDAPIGVVGLQLGFEDGAVTVQGVVPGSPAARDGRLEPGDVLLGIVRSGDRTLFDDMEQGRVMSLMRGKPGTTLTLIVRPKGEGEEREYTLERTPLTDDGRLSQPEEEDATPPRSIESRMDEAAEILDQLQDRLRQDRPEAPERPLPPEIK